MPATLTIGRLAEQAGVGTDTVRYYERVGLLPTPPRRASGYRDYPADSVQRLRFINRAKELGFTLGEIGELLELSGRREHGAADVKRAAEAKLAVVEHKLAELQRVRDGLRTLIDACPGHGPLQHCPIVRALSGEETP
ncbi:heavy metal-responsive transcriptional regulator [Solimonas marina]|uniref:Heavy metal-responsive transcriptional regulator n=1 Tax=Solimonas marina TaxID=2714601 RepID=A0A970B8K2_9GAMM|nr:heavy metal-responsive transcriptional regulator [Solimonas marina]NKF22359.1 heavy metal-responsive transcriptional regulator [Solimonas marina]